MYKVTLFDGNTAPYISNTFSVYCDDIDEFEKNWSGMETDEMRKQRFRRSKQGEMVTDYYSDAPELNIVQNFAWEKSLKAGSVVGKIRNHSMGVLLTNISEGMELDKAVTEYERITAPSNYKRPKAIFTKKMLEDAQKTITELGYLDSLGRRYATLDDITVNDILFSNRDSAKRISGAEAIFADMAKEVSTDPEKFSKVEENSIDKFISDVLPAARELEVFLENKHAGNMVSLIAPQVKDSKTMFKWDNNFGWAYSGNMADSMKERVKAVGGKVDGVLRFSIQWNDTSEYSRNDLDAHCLEPKGGTHIYYASDARKPGRSKFGGQLDVDITNPKKGVPEVENITWSNKNKMKPGVYKFWVHQFSNQGGKDGFIKTEQSVTEETTVTKSQFGEDKEKHALG